jgi:hypothetical protein
LGKIFKKGIMKKLVFIDINLLVDLGASPKIVSKMDPSKIILDISEHEFNLFKSGIFKRFGNKIYFNGETFWLDDKTMNKLKINSKINHLDISKLAISLKDYIVLDKDIKIKFNLDILDELKNSDSDIILFSSNLSGDNYDMIVEKLSEEFEKFGLVINKIIKTSQTFYNSSQDRSINKKITSVIRGFLGRDIDIKSGKFIDIHSQEYDEIYIYDNNELVIKSLMRINFWIEKFLVSSEESLKSLIKGKIKSGNKVLNIIKWGDNKLNRANKTSINIESSVIFKAFENFNLFMRNL